MDIETLRMVVEFLAVPFAGLFFWNFKVLKAELREEIIAREGLNRDLQDYKLHVAETYASNSDLHKFVEAVFNKLERIEDKIDKKADKP